MSSKHTATVPDDVIGNGVQPLRLDLHGIPVELRVSRASLLAYCGSLFRRYLSASQRPAGIVVQLELVDSPPTLAVPHATTVVVRQPPRIVCTANEQRLYLETPGQGAFVIDRTAHTVVGQFTADLVADQGLLDRLLVGSLTLLLREVGFFPVHGFGAACDGRAALLVGKSGSGKTTAGLALVQAGWGFLANDLPLLRDTAQGLEVFSCPERVNVTPETALLLPELQSLVDGREGKLSFFIEDLYPGAMVDQAAVQWLLFPRVSQGQPTQIRPMAASHALRSLLPQSLATWDRSSVAAHFSLLERLVETTPAYQLDLGADFEGWGALLTDLPSTTCRG